MVGAYKEDGGPGDPMWDAGAAYVFERNQGGPGFYTFEVNTAQHYEIWRYNFSWSLLAQGTSSALKPGSQVNNLSIERNGNGITAFANGTAITSLTDWMLTGPLHVGVWVTSASENDLDVRFDNYKVEPIGCGLSASLLSESGELPPFFAPLSTAPAWIDLNLPDR